MSVRHALKWSFLSELASKAVQPLVFIVLARLLTPEDFGVVAAAVMVISFSQVFWEAGMGRALIQRQTDIHEAANVAFWVNLALALIVVAVLFLLAEPIANLIFHDERVIAVLQIMTLQVLLGALSSVHISLLQKEFKFNRLFWVRIATVLPPALISITMALYGMSYWALVFGTLIGQVLQVVMLWNAHTWRPNKSFNNILAVQLIRFGIWVGFSGLLGWSFLWMDSLIVGYYLNAHDLGLYRVGNLFVSATISLIVVPIMPVAYSMFSQIHYDLEKIRKEIFIIGKAIVLLVFPVGAGLFITKDILSNIIFGSQWYGLGEIIGIVAITQAIAYSVSLNQEGYRSIGRPDIETKVMLISLVVRIPFYLIFIQFGLFAFLLARLISTLIGVANHLFFASRVLGIVLSDYVKMVFVALMSSISMLIVGLFFLMPIFDDINIYAKTLIIVLACAVYYFFMVFVFERDFLKYAFSFIKT